MRVPIWPGVRLSVWEKQNPDAVKVTTPFATLHQPVRRVLSMRGWFLLLCRYDWRDKRNQLERMDTPENGAWHTVWLEGKWRWITSKMTAEQREYAADRVAAYSMYLRSQNGGLYGTQEPEGLRWWRDDL